MLGFASSTVMVEVVDSTLKLLWSQYTGAKSVTISHNSYHLAAIDTIVVPVTKLTIV